MNGILRKFLKFINRVIYFKEDTVNHKKVFEELHVIIRTIKPEHDIESEVNFAVFKAIKEVRFDSKNMNLDKETKLETLRKKHQYNYLGHCTYELDYDEYKKIYLNEAHNEIKSIVLSIIDLVNRYQDDPQIIYLLNTYSITVFTISNTIKESMDLNGVITNEIKDDVISILNRFKTAIEGREQEIKQENQRDLDAVNQSLSDRMKSELQYVETHLK